MNIKEEIKLACKHENPEWDGKSFDYGCSIYQNVLECYEAIQPIIEKAGHSGNSYAAFVSIFSRALQGKVLTPITENDFGDNEVFTNDDGTKVYQCVRQGSVFKEVHPDGSVSYSDNDRISTIDQYGIGWHSGDAEHKCSDIIPEIKVPYIPTDNPIEIYVWEFDYSNEKGFYRERGSYNSFYIDKVVFPNGKTVKVDRLYLNDKLTECTPEFYLNLKDFIEKDVKEFKNESR